MAQIILDSSNNLIQGDFDNATVNNRTKFKTTTLNATTNVYAVPNGSATSSGFTATNAADPTNASKITIATNGSTDTQIISGVNGSGTYLPLSFYTNNTLAMQIGTNGQMTIAATANPTFSAYSSATQNTSANVFLKVACGTEEWDTNSNYDNTTNYRFTPTVAGYYQVSCFIALGASTTRLIASIYKNGSQIKKVFDLGDVAAVANGGGTAIVYCNGSTDYIELYARTANSNTIISSGGETMFQAAMIRSA